MSKPLVALALVAGLALGASPAQARYGKSYVDTWLRNDASTVGKFDDGGTMTIHLRHPFATKRVRWVIAPRGAENVTYQLTFSGCATGGGVGFRYFRPNGDEVTSSVLHDGYTFRVDRRSDQRSLFVQATWRARGSDRVCTLHAQGNSRGDAVELRVVTN
jgi:hypothetical protein